MIRHEGFDMPEGRHSTGGRTRRTSYPIVLTHVDAIGLRLAICLLEAGNVVFGRDVSRDSLAAFEAAGGRVLDGDAAGHDAAWSIDCREQAQLRPEALAMMATSRAGYGRPRLELKGSQDGAGSQPVATLVIRAPGDSKSELNVVLRVSPRGPELSVQGGHTLFEEALPLLTALADRVLYAGVNRDARF